MFIGLVNIFTEPLNMFMRPMNIFTEHPKAFGGCVKELKDGVKGFADSAQSVLI